MSFSIGITTFKNRFKRIVGLVNFIRTKGNWPIILAVNGEHKQDFDEEYRKNILNFASFTENCYVSMFPEFRSLSKLWNTILITSPTDWNLIINDDVVILKSFPFKIFEQATIDHKDPKDYCVFAINGSWSHYFTNRKLIAKAGWFDERLLGIGEEDTDMSWRIKSMGFPIYEPKIYSIENIHDGEKPSNIKAGIKHYSEYNRNFLFNEKYEKNKEGTEGMFGFKVKNKLDNIDSYPNETFFWNNKHKLS